MKCARNYALRRVVASADNDLPKNDPSDLFVYKYVYRWKANLEINADVPVPKSQEALVALASC